MSKTNIVCIVDDCLRGFTTIILLKNLGKRFDCMFDDFDIFRTNVENEFGRRIIDIGLETSAVAAARVCERPSRLPLQF